MAKYKKYPSLRNSNIDWLGDIPTSWGTNRFKNIFKIRKRIAGRLGYQILSITQRGIKIKDIKSGDGQLSMDYSKYQIVNPHDFAMNHMDLLTGFVDTSDHKGVTSPDYRVFTLEDANSDRRYFLYLLQLCYIGKIFYPLGQGAAQVGRWRLPADAFNEFLSPLPPLPEQKQIAHFLDHETGKIDRLIQKQQQLIELLKEKRQAVISHAVTKGLNPNAPLKPTNIEWLGNVPEHWRIKSLRYLGRCQNGLNIGGEAFGTGHPFVNYGDVYKHRILPKTGSGLVQSLKSDRVAYSVKASDVFFTRTSESIEEIGFSSTCLSTIDNATFAGFLIRFRPNSNELDAEFSKFYFSNILLRAFFIKEMNLITRASLSQDLLKKLPVTLPPQKEQQRIAQYLDKKTAVFNKLELQSTETIGLLKERRTALISAAVTGKIDVRDWCPSGGKSGEEKG